MAIDNAFFEMWRPRALAVLRIVTAYLLIAVLYLLTKKAFKIPIPGRRSHSKNLTLISVNA